MTTFALTNAVIDAIQFYTILYKADKWEIPCTLPVIPQVLLMRKITHS